MASSSDLCDVALIGLAVMGQNLLLNIASHGYTTIAHNRTVSKIKTFLELPDALAYKCKGADSIKEMCERLKTPRKIILLVKAGDAVDEFLEMIIPHLEKGDIVMDGGNSHYPDTTRRCKYMEDKGFLFVGAGVSGGEEGARYGPSIMPGGSKAAWPALKPILQAACAKVGSEPCCEWVGEGGSGHYVKMVHNGIEYGDMQLICEAYDLLKSSLGLNADEIADIFASWNKSELDSFLIEISADIFKYKDTDGKPLVDKIRDTAGQKGTGKWTAISALDMGTPVTLIGEAVFARCLSSIKDERTRASKVLTGPKPQYTGDKAKFIEDIRQALYASKIISYAQGFMLLREAAKEYKWHLNMGGIALMWRGGCIIRSVFLGNIRDAYLQNPELECLLFDKFFSSAIDKAQASWRRVVSQAALVGIPTPAFSTALSFYDGYRREVVPANLLQAQRDYFGAHTYELVDAPGKWIHTNWTGRGGDVASSTYNA